MKNRTVQVASWLFPLLLLCAAPAAAGAPSAEQEVVVRIEPAQLVVGEGLTAAVEVRVEGVRDLYALDIRLAFDPTSLEVVDADPAVTGAQVRPGDLLKLDVVARNTADNQAGSIWFAMSQANPTPAVSGSGTAFAATFRGRSGGRSFLAVSYARLATRDGRAIPVAVQGGEVAVVAAVQAPATPTPAPPPERPALEQTALAPKAPATPAAPTQAGPALGEVHTPIPALLAAVAGGLLALGIDSWQRRRGRRGA